MFFMADIGRVSILPKMAMHIKVEINANGENSHNPVLAFVLKSRKKKYIISIPNTSVHQKVMEGTKFSYKKFNKRHVIWAAGPLYAEMVILVRRDCE